MSRRSRAERPRSEGRQTASRIAAAKSERSSDVPAAPISSKIVPAMRRAELQRRDGDEDERYPARPQGFSRCPVRNSHELHATMTAASAPVTPSASTKLTSLVPRKP